MAAVGVSLLRSAGQVLITCSEGVISQPRNWQWLYQAAADRRGEAGSRGVNLVLRHCYLSSGPSGVQLAQAGIIPLSLPLLPLLQPMHCMALTEQQADTSHEPAGKHGKRTSIA